MKHEKHDIDIKITKNSEDKINEFDDQSALKIFLKGIVFKKESHASLFCFSPDKDPFHIRSVSRPPVPNLGGD